MTMPQPELYTFADALSWGEDSRTELLYGTPMLMAPPTRAHQKACGALFAQLYQYLQGKKCEVYPAPFAVRPFAQAGDTPEGTDTMVEPDITVVCDLDKLDDLGCKGAPDLVIEVLSPSTERHDRFVKFNLYQRAGVREYWLVNPQGKTVQSFVLEEGRYTAHDFAVAGEQMPVSVLAGCVLDLSQVFEE